MADILSKECGEHRLSARRSPTDLQESERVPDHSMS
jgi:hypothetical protein